MSRSRRICSKAAATASARCICRTVRAAGCGRSCSRAGPRGEAEAGSLAQTGEGIMDSPLFGPIVALVAWTFVMMIWMYATRFPALARKGISLKGRVGSKGGDLDGVIEPEVQWKAHNHNHLLEQPN